jgi:hypothetical protein
LDESSADVAGQNTRRWDGYLEFQRRPEPMLGWFAKHMQ